MSATSGTIDPFLCKDLSTYLPTYLIPIADVTKRDS